MELLKLYLWFAAGVGSVAGLVAFSLSLLDAWVPWALCWVPWVWFVLWRDRAAEWSRRRAARSARREADAWIAAINKKWEERARGDQ